MMHPKLPPSGSAVARLSTRWLVLAAGVFAGSCSIKLHAQQTTWLGPMYPPEIYQLAMAFDSQRGVTVVLAGMTLEQGEADPTETWECDGVSWVRRNVPGPAARYDPAMAYDSGRGIVVLFGGYGYGDTWEWDGQSWTERTTTGLSWRWGHAMAYDAHRGVTVLFGGSGGTGSAGQTWEWDGNTWMQRPVAGPPGRFFHAMTYDAARGVTVLFGGVASGGGTELSDTWEWDGTSWAQRLIEGPISRRRHSMAFDTDRNVTVLYGGYRSEGSNHFLQDTWEWDGNNWVQRSDSAPGGQYGTAMAYDSYRQQTVRYGGYKAPAGESSNGTLWAWDGSSWTRGLGGGPSGRCCIGLTYDSVRKVSLLFGGQTCSDYAFHDDLWSWDGRVWEQLATSGPSPRIMPGMVFDSARAMVVLFGGQDPSYAALGDTWEWDGTAWVFRDVPGPSPRAVHTMAYDSARHVTVLFGGWAGGDDYVLNNETWEWDGASWTLRSVEGPPPRWCHAMAYDAQHGVVVLYGGHGTSQQYYDTWAWDGISWQQYEVSDSPPYGWYSMLYDSTRGMIVLNVSYDSSPYPTETWEWDGHAWRRQLTIGPPPRRSFAMTYDENRGTTVLFGGLGREYSGYEFCYDDTWEYIVQGDMNCDGLANGADVSAFVWALTDRDRYRAELPACNLLRADLDHDGAIGLADLALFVTALVQNP